MINNDNVLIAPSLLSADFSRLGDEIQRVAGAGADMLHLDVMDGAFVPNITFGPMVVRAIRGLTDLPLDCHLMVERPERYVQDFVRAGADYVTVHAEATPHVHRALQRVSDAGAIPGIALNPSTPPELVQDMMPYIGLALVMTVNPGFGGQKYIGGMEEKVRRMASLIAREQRGIVLQVDGGITAETASLVIEAGATALVSGSYIFGATDLGQAVQRLRSGRQ